MDDLKTQHIQYHIASKIVAKWKEIIESYSIEVKSVELFRMDRYYKGYPEIEYCYKVNFNFGVDSGNYWGVNSKVRLLKELERNFIDRFQPVLIDNKKKGYDYGETKFHNDKVDYFTNQGHRIIIQFYPQGFLDELREDKLNQLGI
jgi:hypothetical protein